MSELFPNQYWGMDIWKHQELPIIESHDFNFFRCIEFNNSDYLQKARKYGHFTGYKN